MCSLSTDMPTSSLKLLPLQWLWSTIKSTIKWTVVHCKAIFCLFLVFITHTFFVTHCICTGLSPTPWNSFSKITSDHQRPFTKAQWIPPPPSSWKLSILSYYAVKEDPVSCLTSLSFIGHLLTCENSLRFPHQPSSLLPLHRGSWMASMSVFWLRESGLLVFTDVNTYRLGDCT